MRYNSKKVFYWDLVIIGLSIYQAFSVPLTFAFEDYNAKFSVETDSEGKISYSRLYYLNLVIEWCYVFDTFNSFFISYMDVTNGDEIFALRRIAKNYITGSFIFDFLSLTPLFTTSRIVASFKAFKLIRVARIGDLIRGLNVDLDLKTYG
jgi:hypothetical protein